MTSLDPKKLFQENKPIAAELQAHREDFWLRTGFVFSLSKMAHDGASEQALAGARAFIGVFQNLWEPDRKPVELPVKSLSMDAPTSVDEKK